jgi:hypothetical protein
LLLDKQSSWDVLINRLRRLGASRGAVERVEPGSSDRVDVADVVEPGGRDQQADVSGVDGDGGDARG